MYKIRMSCGRGPDGQYAYAAFALDHGDHAVTEPAQEPPSDSPEAALGKFLLRHPELHTYLLNCQLEFPRYAGK